MAEMPECGKLLVYCILHTYTSARRSLYRVIVPQEAWEPVTLPKLSIMIWVSGRLRKG